MKVAAKKVMRALCVIMTMTSMMLNLLTKKSEDLLSSQLSLFAFDEINERGHKVSFFPVLSTKTSSKYLSISIKF